MKKILLLIMCIILVSGCSKESKDSVLKNFSKKISESSSYTLEGNMTLLSNNEEYNYDVLVNYLRGEYYQVKLYNKTSNTEQIILKNDEGVYVVTPSINKSFKFQSEWPNNSSQAYILENILADIQNDDDRVFDMKEDNYTFVVDVNYPNNKNLYNQRITLGKDYLPNKVEVMDKDGINQITLNITNILLNNEINKSIFDLKNNIDDTCCTKSEENTAAYIEEVLYPTYLPTNTTFHSQESVSLVDGERVILTFSGEKGFVMVEEATNTNEDMEVESVYGELTFVDDTIGAVSNNSIMWNKGNIEYYIQSDSLSEEELVQVASSMLSAAVSK